MKTDLLVNCTQKILSENESESESESESENKYRTRAVI